MDPDALGPLIDRHAAALGLYARQWCAAPDDVVQAAFVKLVRLRRPPDRPAAWLYAAVRHAAIDAGKAERRRARHEAAAAGEAPPWFLPPDDPAGLDAAAAAAALETLPADERAVIVARLWGGLSFAEVAAAVGGSAATCHRRYAAGLDRLRERLGVTREKP